MNTQKSAVRVTASMIFVIALIAYAVANSDYPPEKFIYGVWGNAVLEAEETMDSGLSAYYSGTDNRFSERMDLLQDTLGFNMSFNKVWNSATAESLINRGYNVVETDGYWQSGKPSDYAMGWYLVWQSDQDNIPDYYQGRYYTYGGRQTIDSGDTVWVIGNEPGDTAGWVVRTGGSHYKYKPLDAFPNPTERKRAVSIRMRQISHFVKLHSFPPLAC